MKTRTLMTALSLATALAVPAQAQTDTWEIDTAHSQSTFSVKHLMVTTVRGQFGKTSGKVQWNGKDVSTISVEATIDATTINTREQKRDDHLRSADFFDVEKYPHITFKSKKVELTGDDEARITGDLTIRDITREVVIEAEYLGQTNSPFGDKRVGFSGSTKIDREQWGLTWNVAMEAGGVLVSKDIKISLDVEAVLVTEGETATA